MMNKIFEKGTYRVLLSEIGNTLHTYKATIDATESFTEDEIKQDMFKEFKVKGNIDNFRIAIMEQ